MCVICVQLVSFIADISYFIWISIDLSCSCALFVYNVRFAILVLVFFFTSSKVTRVGEEKKRVIDAEFKKGGQRNW
jgi:Integral membrane protein DUF92